MRDDLLYHYERELTYLRRLGAEFGKKYPKVAARLQLEPGKPGYVEAHRLLAFLKWFEPMPVEPVPYNSILREFVGGSNLEKFEPWRKA